MGTNGYVGQIQGPFAAGEDIMVRIREQCNHDILTVFKIAIYSDEYHMVKINNLDFEIGKTKMFEVRDTDIIALSFNQDEPVSTFVEYMYLY